MFCFNITLEFSNSYTFYDYINHNVFHPDANKVLNLNVLCDENKISLTF